MNNKNKNKKNENSILMFSCHRPQCILRSRYTVVYPLCIYRTWDRIDWWKPYNLPNRLLTGQSRLTYSRTSITYYVGAHTYTIYIALGNATQFSSATVIGKVAYLSVCHNIYLSFTQCLYKYIFVCMNICNTHRITWPDDTLVLSIILHNITVQCYDQSPNSICDLCFICSAFQYL